MAADILDIFLADRKVGTINGLGGDRTVFTFDDAYADDPNRPTLSLSFKDAMGDLIRDQRRTQTRLSPFFSNLLPEGPLRDYLAERAGVNVVREFYLLWALGRDLPGAVIARGPDGEEPGPAHEEDPAAVFTCWCAAEVFRAGESTGRPDNSSDRCRRVLDRQAAINPLSRRVRERVLDDDPGEVCGHRCA